MSTQLQSCHCCQCIPAFCQRYYPFSCHKQTLYKKINDILRFLLKEVIAIQHFFNSLLKKFGTVGNFSLSLVC